jgi:hypothetical protein
LSDSQKIQLLADLKDQLAKEREESSMAVNRSLMIEPSEYYMHDVKKFIEGRHQKGDTVRCY